ncbi:hypothetical protein RB653_006015 [Dictyostelium firmibasis]|uniref:GATA-type domain-containing protein n=1 Tax=Dictyostelium firmibasis TaxID=79012 RepID=A0AAN7YTG2_9MYCE
MTSFLLFNPGSLQQQQQPQSFSKDFINSSNNINSNNNNNNYNNNSNCQSSFTTPLGGSNGFNNPNSTTTTNPLSGSNGINNSNIEVIDIDQCLKHCGCRNPKELIQLIRSDAIENIEVSWPDDMGLWYMNTIKSHEVSLQNLVEGVRVAGQLLLLDPTSARFDLSKKQKTIVVRSVNIDRSSSNLSSEDDDCCYETEEDDIGEDGEVVRSPQSKFSLLLDESEKFRKNFSLKKSSRSAFKKNKKDYHHGSSAGGGGSGGVVVLHYDNNGNQLHYSNTTDNNSRHHQHGGVGDGYPHTPPSTGGKSLGKRGYQQWSNNNNNTNNTNNGVGSNVQNDEDLDASWLEEIKRNRAEVVPDLSSPVLFSMDKRSPSPTLGSSCGSSSPGLNNSGNEMNNSLDSPLGVSGGNGNSLNISSGIQCPPGANIDSAEKAILEGQIHLPPLLRPRQYHACKTSKENRPTKRRKNHTSLFCRHCGTTDTPEWRRGPDGRKSLCNACGLHYSKLVKRENMAVPELSRTFELSEILNPSD